MEHSPTLVGQTVTLKSNVLVVLTRDMHILIVLKRRVNLIEHDEKGQELSDPTIIIILMMTIHRESFMVRRLMTTSHKIVIFAV